MAEKKTAAETERLVDRAFLEWLNEYPGFPERVGKIEAGFLSAGTCMGLFAEEAPFRIREYISGAYTAQLRTALQYRIAAASSGRRLGAAEILNRIAGWAEQRDELPDLGPGKQAVSVARGTPAVLTARHEDGTEDYQILITLTYECFG